MTTVTMFVQNTDDKHGTNDMEIPNVTLLPKVGDILETDWGFRYVTYLRFSYSPDGAKCSVYLHVSRNP